MATWWLKWRLAIGLLLAGAFHALSFAPDPLPAWALSPLELIAMAWLVRCVWRAPNALMAARRAWLFALAHFVVGLYWLTISMHTYGLMPLPLAILALIALSAFLAVYASLAAAVAYKISALQLSNPRRAPAKLIVAALVWAAAWTLCEWLRGTLFTGFGWLNSGYAHMDSWFAGWAPVLGIYGVTLVAAFTAAAIAALANSAQRTPTHQPKNALIGLLALALAAAGWGFKQHAWTANHGQPLLVRLVQGDIEQGIKFTPSHIQNTIETHLKLAATPTPPTTPSPSLVLLPETALAVFQHQLSPAVWNAWRALAAEQNSTLMMGAALFDRATGAYTNSVIGIDQTTPLEALTSGHVAMRYDKHHLVPFGEFVPWGFRWFVDLLAIPMGDFNRGSTQQQPFAVGDQYIAPNICYEDVFGEELLPALMPAPLPGASAPARAVTPQPGATILANFSNLGWFGDSWALRQHWQMARMRALETSRPMLRATNTGMTGAIDPQGRTLASLPPHRAAVLDISVQGQRGLTPYSSVGNLPVLLLAGFVLLIGFYRRNKHPTQ
ncbi:MAG: apolipoprotein N-acyltransferase [Alcaligenaceae bacterium]